MSELTRTTLAIEKALLEKFDRWMAQHGYTNRSEAMRDLVRQALVEQEWSDPKADVVAALSIVYDHAAHTLAQQLTSLQHEDHHAILCSQHVHLDHHRWKTDPDEFECLKTWHGQFPVRVLPMLRTNAILRCRGSPHNPQSQHGSNQGYSSV
jgi:nickel-responsive transcriptional regulator NikR